MTSFICLIYLSSVLLLFSNHGASAGSLFPIPQRRSVDDATLQSCLVTAGLTTITPALSDPHEYYLLSQSDNLVFHYNPSAIVLAKVTADVQDAVNCAARSNIAVAARSGGHSFGGYGSGGMDGSLIIDLSNMNRTFSDPGRGTAEVQPGARLGDVAKDLYRQQNGQRGMPHGTCPTVGTGGHALCGGFGPMSRKWGMAMDQLIEADVVLADGSMVTASDNENPELFWGLKGSGSFFGIVTRFLFRTQDASAPTTFFEYEWGENLGSPNMVIQLVLALQTFAQTPTFPDEMGFHIQFSSPPRSHAKKANAAIHISMRGAYLGPKRDFERVMQPLWSLFSKRMIPMPLARIEKQDSYIAQIEDWDDFGEPGEKLDTLTERTRHNNFVVKTLLTVDHTKGFTESSLEDFFHYLWKTGRQADRNDVDSLGRTSFWAWNIYFELFGGPSAAYRNEEVARTSSFAHRDGMWLIQLSVGTLPEQTLSRKSRKYLNKLYVKMQGALRAAGMQQASYSCYTDPDLKEEEWRPFYYGDSITRLERLKAQVDPKNLFRNPQTLGNKEQIQNRFRGNNIDPYNEFAESHGHVHPSPRGDIEERSLYHHSPHPLP